MDILTVLGKRIQSLREDRRLTQEDIEEKTGINARYLSSIECGNRNVTMSTLEKIAKGLDIEIYELFLYKKGESREESLRRAIDKLAKEADSKKLQIYFDVMRGIMSV